MRGISRQIDKAIRERARISGRSLNAVALAALADGAGLGAQPLVRRDLADIAGTWKKDAVTEQALAAQDKIDKGDWK
ncbi:MAG: hypothetical protein MUF51_05720 [Vicinamibacteria bacterium]|nr:hypothetical protein [Vicinamibacteria bacterium]